MTIIYTNSRPDKIKLSFYTKTAVQFFEWGFFIGGFEAAYLSKYTEKKKINN
jgi:hypothetical protein